MKRTMATSQGSAWMVYDENIVPLFHTDRRAGNRYNKLMHKRIVIGSDHAGYALKEILRNHCMENGIDVLDEGTFSEDPVDYPVIGKKVVGVMLSEKIPGVFLGGSGLGEAMVGNKIPGIRAARCATPEDAELTRKHNDANMLCLGGRTIDAEEAKKTLDAFLSTAFEGGRHEQRVQQMHELDGYPYGN